MAVSLEKAPDSSAAVPAELLEFRRVLPGGKYFTKHTFDPLLAALMSKQQYQKTVKARNAAAADVVSQVSDYLELNSYEKLVGCSPIIYQESNRDGKTFDEAGALVIRCAIETDDSRAVHDIWIDDEHRPLSNDATTFLGAIAESKAADGAVWDFIHLAGSQAGSGRSPRDEMLRQAASPVTQLPLHTVAPIEAPQQAAA